MSGLSHANDLQEMLIIQTEYMQALANAFGERPKVLTELVREDRIGCDAESPFRDVLIVWHCESGAA